ncbi:MAG: phosphoribosyltransferase [Methylococcales bacterium]
MARYVIEHIESGKVLDSRKPFIRHDIPNLIDKTDSLKGVWNEERPKAEAQQALLGDGYRLLKVIEKFQKTPRTSWDDFPFVVYQANLGSAKNADIEHNPTEGETIYQKAKSGDPHAAYRIAEELINDEALNSIKEIVGDRKPLIVPVISEEITGCNKLPLAYAHLLSENLGVDVETDIVQCVRAHHTDAGAWHRIAHNPAFTGKVEKGRDYIVVDDTMAMGGTMASLRGYIESEGGKVLAVSTLTGLTTHAEGSRLAITDKMVNALNNKHPGLDEYLKDEFGYGVDCLTQGESGHFKKAPNLDAIKERVNDARVAADYDTGDHISSECVASVADILNKDGVDKYREYSADLNVKPSKGTGIS